ncbi:MAG: hypothetical protein Q8N23_33090 [Archangium sp.]|nr:hypothetical protein [Archangium sp.]MDP3157552.1 hypothetical protein [Archangium sp.]MDP3574316.1 hypothetical protein [Archangium sp.]
MGRNLAFAALTLTYPLAIWLLGDSVEPRWLALSLVLLGALRLAATGQRMWIGLALGAFGLAAITGVLNVGWPLRWYPVFINGSLLVLFGVTLFRPPSMAERLARLREPDLPPHAVEYTRKVTMAWCGFFIVNGALAAATSLWGTDAQWALYNGGIAYGLMGVFAGAEYLVRLRVKKAHAQVTEVPSPRGGEGQGEG